MALSFSHLQVRLLFFHRHQPTFPRIQRIPTSTTSTVSSPKVWAVRCSAKPNDQITLRTCKNCKIQYDPALNHPRACSFHTAHFGGMLRLTDLFSFLHCTFVSSFYCTKNSEENVLEICNVTGILTSRKKQLCRSTRREDNGAGKSKRRQFGVELFICSASGAMITGM